MCAQTITWRNVSCRTNVSDRVMSLRSRFITHLVLFVLLKIETYFMTASTRPFLFLYLNTVRIYAYVVQIFLYKNF
jgi:hypothetical protein